MIVAKKRFLHVSFALPLLTDQQRSAVEKLLDTAGDWLRYGSTCWIIYSSHEPITWANRIETIPGVSQGGFLVVEIGAYAGILDPKVWDWMNRPRDTTTEEP
jgi:hypothetical protein